MPQANQPKIFISHSWEDKPLVRRLEKELQAAGAEVWVDHEGIRGGDNLPERISEALEWCNTLVLVWTNAASQSDWVKLEWSNAVSLKKAIIPCRVDNAKLPAILAHKAYVPFSEVEAGLAQLLQALRLSEPEPLEKTEQVEQLAAHASHSLLLNAAHSIALTKPIIGGVIRLRSKPAMLLDGDVKSMLLKYGFFCSGFGLNKDLNNTQGKGVANQFERRQNGLTVFDQRTGLTWQQSGSSACTTLAKAQEYVNSINELRFAGSGSWRLPTLEEGMSLIKKIASNGLHIDPLFSANQRWIWTTDMYSPTMCWVVHYRLGYCYNREVEKGSYVRLVR